MEWLNFGAALAESLAWPLATASIAIFLGLVFKEPIQHLIARMTRISHNGMVVEFQIPQLPDEAQQPDSIDERTRQDIRDNPPMMVSGAWERFISEAAGMLRERGVIADPASPQLVIRALTVHNFLDEMAFEAVDGLRDIRDRVVHQRDLALTPEMAERYVTAAAGMTYFLQLRARRDSSS